jgi:protein SCO1/2
MRALRILAVGVVVSLGILGFRWWFHNRAEKSSQAEEPFVRVPDSNVLDGQKQKEGSLPHPLQPGQPLPETVLTNQDGQEFRISDFHGEVLVLAFFYSHCDLPSMCPLTTAKLIQTSEQARKMGLQEIQFLLVSFDPERDQPQRLREYAHRFEVDATRFTLATGSSTQIESLSRTLNTYYRPSSTGVFDHNTTVSVVDREGKLMEVFHGPEWLPEDLIDSLKNL